jgi:hypothetical protein
MLKNPYATVAAQLNLSDVAYANAKAALEAYLKARPNLPTVTVEDAQKADPALADARVFNQVCADLRLEVSD